MCQCSCSCRFVCLLACLFVCLFLVNALKRCVILVSSLSATPHKVTPSHGHCSQTTHWHVDIQHCTYLFMPLTE